MSLDLTYYMEQRHPKLYLSFRVLKTLLHLFLMTGTLLILSGTQHLFDCKNLPLKPILTIFLLTHAFTLVRQLFIYTIFDRRLNAFVTLKALLYLSDLIYYVLWVYGNYIILEQKCSQPNDITKDNIKAQMDWNKYKHSRNNR